MGVLDLWNLTSRQNFLYLIGNYFFLNPLIFLSQNVTFFYGNHKPDKHIKRIRHLSYFCFYFLSLDLPYNFFMFSTYIKKGYEVFLKIRAPSYF